LRVARASALSERSIELSSGTTHVRVEGSGVPWVWTHGFTSSIELEDGLGMGALLRGYAGVQLVRYDARGHGRSAPGRDEAAHSWSALGADLLELLERLGLERAVAGGASMGVATSLYAALREPRRFAGLVLLMPPTAWETRKAQADVYRGGAGLVESRGSAAYANALREFFRAQPIPGFGPERVEALAASIESRNAADLARLLRGAAASDLPDPARIRALSLPALVIATRDDPGHPLSTAERLVELLPAAELVVLSSLADQAPAREPLARFLARVAS
jgi:pimeloyl-ACP methyl ester carboxylesterase